MLRRAYGRGLRGTVGMQKNRVGSDRVHNMESTPCAALCKDKDERLKLVLQFVAKYKDSNNGRLPGISVLRREVGGKYEILKEILHGIKSEHEELEMEFPAGGTQVSPLVRDYGREKQPLPTEVLEKEEKLVSQRGKTTEIKKGDNITDSRVVVKAMEQRELSKKSGKDTLQPIMDISVGIDEDGNDSDVAAPEYQYTPLPQMENLSKPARKRMELLPEFSLFVTGVPAFTTCADLRAAFEDCGEILNASVTNLQSFLRTRGNSLCATINFKTEEGLKAAKMKERVLLRGQVIDLKLNWNGNTATKLKMSEVKQAKSQYCASKTKAQQTRLDVVNDVKNEPARHLQQVNGDFGFEGKASPLTRRSQLMTVRIVNLPVHVTESQLKLLCESIASVYRLDFRRGQIADVHFNVKETEEINDVLHRLRKVDMGDCRLEVFPVQRFSCRNDTNNCFKARDVCHFKEVRENLLRHFEQCFQQLRFQFQDYRELVTMKRAV